MALGRCLFKRELGISRHSSFGAAKRERLTRVLVRDGVDVLAVAIKTALHDATTKLDFAIGIVEIIESATRGSRRVFFAFSEFSPVHIIRRRSHSRFLIRSTISRVMMSNE